MFGRTSLNVALGVAMLSVSPLALEAAPIGVSGAAACAALSTEAAGVAAERCFVVDPLSGTPLAGQFESDNDVALFRFILDEGTAYNFSAFTSSYGDGIAGGFDPIISLYGPDLFHVTFGDGPFPAIGVDINDDPDPANAAARNLDDQIPAFEFVASAGVYTLALTQALNFHQEGLLFDFDADAASSLFTDFYGSERTNGFSVQVNLSAVDASPAPIPEPGTLTLLGIGSALAAVARRRRKPEPQS